MIISAGDCTREVYVIIEGEVRVEDISSLRELAILTEGNYFGEANVIYNLTGHRTANVISNTISKLGVIDEVSMTILLEAFPAWAQILVKKTENRLKETLGNSEFESLQRRILKSPRFAMATAARPQAQRRGSIVELVVDLEKPDIAVKVKIWIEILHLALIVYTSFSITFVMGFDIKVESWILAMEVICTVESFIYIIFHFVMIARAMKE
jgi:CRP-like cAMP-binding protein